MDDGGPVRADDPLAFLNAGGDMARRIAEHDWSATLGPVSQWPASLKTTVGLLLRSPVPIALLWGQDGVMIYNDAYSVVAGGRHPEVLGGKVREAWPEVADFNDNVMRVGLAGGALAYRDQELTLFRSGQAEQVWLNLDYSPVVDESGTPAGVIAIVVETTPRVRNEAALRASEARLRFLDSLGSAVAGLSEADQILAVTTRMMGEHLGLSNCAYADMDEDEDGFTIRGNWHAPGSPSIIGHYSLAAFGKLAVKNLGAGLPLVVNDNLAELAPEEAATFQNIGIAATICMPLVKDGRLTALMAIHDKKPRTWTDDELALLREVTERSWAHVERVGAEAELRESEALQRAITDATPECIKLVGSDGALLQMNSVGLRMIEADGFDQVSGLEASELIAPEHRAAWRENHRRVLAGEKLSWEYDIVGLKGARRAMETHAVPLELPDGRVAQLAVTRDVTQRKAADEHLRLMVLELNHRVKNNLATVQAIAVQTLRGADDLAVAREAFLQRLTTLAAAHDILTREQWEGVGMAEVSRAVLDALDGACARVDFDGPKVRLTPKAALAVSMALHELGANALKYGALRQDGGRVRLEWRPDLADPEKLTIRWTEQGGPPVTPPARRGFGSRLLERGLAAELGGRVEMDFAPGGLRCVLTGSMLEPQAVSGQDFPSWPAADRASSDP
jgi:PAS domain S-box-containing protein